MAAAQAADAEAAEAAEVMASLSLKEEGGQEKVTGGPDDAGGD